MGRFYFESDSPNRTNELGLAIAQSLQPGLLLTLDGTLGAGKTNLVQAIAQGLGISRDRVNSPTFTLMQQHAGRLDLVHIDAYRIADEDQYLELGIDESIDSDAIVAMEWAKKFASCLPADRLAIDITVQGENSRRFEISWPDGPSESEQRATATSPPGTIESGRSAPVSSLARKVAESVARTLGIRP